MVDAHGHDGLIFGCIAIKEFWWDIHHVWRFGAQFLGLVTISKLLVYLHALSLDDNLACSCSCFVLHVVNTSLNVVFIKTCIYTCTSSEQQIDSYMFALHAHLYPLYAHV